MQKLFRTLKTRKAREIGTGYLFLLPAFSFLIVFVAIPAIWGMLLSFTKWDMVMPPRFVGLEQWINVFNSREARTSIGVTLGIVFTSAPIALVIGLGLALLLDKLPFMKVFYRTAFFAPFVATLTAVSYVWCDLFNTQHGFINYVLEAIGMQPVSWLIYPATARISIAIVLIWQNLGFNMLMCLAGLQSLDQTYYEAAVVDGAKRRHLLFHITIPLLSPILFLLAINMIISGFQLYDSVYVITAGGPGYSTATMVYFIQRMAFRNYNIGLASALSVVLFIFIAISTLIMWKIQNRWVHYGD